MTFNEEKKIKKDVDVKQILPPDNPVFASSPRLTIMLILFSKKKAGFTELQKLLNITPGKLDHHIKKLENENYVKRQKVLFPSRPFTVIKITKHGEKVFKDYLYKLRDVLNKI